MTATSTPSSEAARASVSLSRHRYKSTIADAGRLGARRVFTCPTLGAFAMMTSKQWSVVADAIFRSGEDMEFVSGNYAGCRARARGRRKPYHTIRLRMHHAAPMLPLTVPLIFDCPMRG